MVIEYHIGIKDMPVSDRPRERLLAEGSEALSNTELLAILIRTGTPTASALNLAAQTLKELGGLRGLVQAGLDELQAIKGLGPAKGAQIKAALELGKRIASLGPENRTVIRCPEDVKNLVMEEMRYLDREHFRTISLNTKNHVLAVDTVSIGSLNSSIVHPRELFKNPIKRSSAALILVHNHPSGDPTPSKEDIEVTKRLSDAGKLLGIEILDHIIIGDQKYISLKEKALL